MSNFFQSGSATLPGSNTQIPIMAPITSSSGKHRPISQSVHPQNPLAANNQTTVMVTPALNAEIPAQVTQNNQNFAGMQDILTSLCTLVQNQQAQLNSVSNNNSSYPNVPRLNNNYIKPIPVPRWEIPFNGDTQDVKLRRFLNKVKFLASAEGITLDNVLRDIHHLLKGNAYNWYYPRRHNFSSWLIFEQAIAAEFIRPDYDEFIIEKIKSFKQQNEDFSSFYSQIEMLFVDLEEPFPDMTKLRIVKRNLSAFYRDKILLLDITTTQQLYDICKKIQNGWNDTNNFTFRRRNDINEHYVHSSSDMGTNTDHSVQFHLFQLWIYRPQIS
jgi:hypothetical protein